MHGRRWNFFKISRKFLINRYQRVALHGKVFCWTDVKEDVPQGSILGPSSFFIYINDWSKNLKSTGKLFADDTSIFHVVKDPNTSGEMLNHNLTKISEWTYKQKT